jgi:hypothetical protein
VTYDLRQSLELGSFVQSAYNLYDDVMVGDGGLTVTPPYELLTNLYWAELGDDAPSVCGFVLQNGGEITVALRGTTSVLEILHDIFFLLKSFPYAPVGETEWGFTNLYITLKTGLSESDPRACEYIGKLTGITSIRITGHSLGAAVATLLAVEIAAGYASSPVPIVYTFASPRVGDKLFAANYDSLVPETYRIVNAPDYVPTLPPAWTGYCHVDTEIPINSGVTTKGNVGCWHSLATYLYTLNANIPLGSTCVP